MKIKHWQGYGTVTATKVKDKSRTLHVRVEGNHEWGLYRNDDYDLFRWLVKRFDKTVGDDYFAWHKSLTDMRIVVGWNSQSGVETCDYYFMY